MFLGLGVRLGVLGVWVVTYSRRHGLGFIGTEVEGDGCRVSGQA